MAQFKKAVVWFNVLAVVAAGVLSLTVYPVLTATFRLERDQLTIFVLIVTAWALFWYTWETRQLRLGQAKQQEIENMPWLKCSGLKPETKLVAAWWGEVLWLPTTNMGKTPAFDVTFSVTRKDGNGSQVRAGVIVPGDTAHVRLCDSAWESDPDVDVVIDYATYAGAKCKVTQHFFRHAQGWGNRPGEYSFSTSDGRHYRSLQHANGADPPSVGPNGP